MAQKFDDNEPDFSRLLAVLLESGLQSSNNALYQVISTLIRNANTSFRSLRGQVNTLTGIISGGSSSVGVTGATYLTELNETALLPNSRREIAGDGIEFDDSVANVRTVNNAYPHPFLLMGGGVRRNGSNPIVTGDQWLPMTIGGEPIEFMSDGLGNSLLIEHTLP